MRSLPSLIAFLIVYLIIPSARAQSFYGSGVQEVRVEIPFKDWDYKLDSMKKANGEARILGTAWVNGLRFDSAGIRYKGNSSYFRTRNETYKKLPFNIKLDYKIKSQKMPEGQKTVKLSNAFLDPSFVRDPLAYEIIRQYMPAPLCNFTRYYVNNKYYGLYINTESIDENFLEKHFGTSEGYVIKCDPDNWKRVRSQTGCPKGENASLAYLNDNFGCYDAFYEVDDPGAWKYLLQLIKVLNKNTDKIETVLDVDQTLWMLALNNVLVNLDSYNGSLSHNYYLWVDTTGVCHPLIWDLNMAFGGWRRNFSFEEMKDDEIIQYQPLAEIDNNKRPLIAKLLRNSYYRKIYLAHFKTIVNDYLKSGKYLSRAQDMMREIDPWVKLDSLKLYGYDDFQNSLEKTMHTGPDHVIGIRQLMDKRTQWLLKHPLLNKVQPEISDVKHAPDASDIKITAKIVNATNGWLMYRSDRMFAFTRTRMYDDGTHGDATADDGLYTAKVAAEMAKHYYIAAEGSEGAATLPERASFEYFETKPAAKKKQ
ncbi:MAG: CotH kinase family protein [Lewinellaceae bacterium]|nr:CotH kinase family protein [Lewinellaceae bacterium]